MNNKYSVVRTDTAGAFFGIVEKRNGKEVEMSDARRLYYWSGAATLSEIAVRGVSKPSECKFPAPVNIILTEAIEIIEATDEAVKNIKAVPIWTV